MCIRISYTTRIETTYQLTGWTVVIKDALPFIIAEVVFDAVTSWYAGRIKIAASV